MRVEHCKVGTCVYGGGLLSASERGSTRVVDTLLCDCATTAAVHVFVCVWSLLFFFAKWATKTRSTTVVCAPALVWVCSSTFHLAPGSNRTCTAALSPVACANDVCRCVGA